LEENVETKGKGVIVFESKMRELSSGREAERKKKLADEIDITLGFLENKTPLGDKLSGFKERKWQEEGEMRACLTKNTQRQRSRASKDMFMG
jgi:hypothetical protein